MLRLAPQIRSAQKVKSVAAASAGGGEGTMPWWMVASIVILTVLGAGLIIWRRQATELQGMTFGARLHPGCAVVEGVALLLVALLYFVIARGR